MKNVWIVVGVIVAIIIFCAIIGAGGKVSEVKGGCFPLLDSTRTINDVFESKMNNLEWKEFKNEKNQEIVQAKGTWKAEKLNIGSIGFIEPGDKLIFQFAYNNGDDSWGDFKPFYFEVQEPNGNVRKSSAGTKFTSSDLYSDGMGGIEFIQLLYK